MSEGWGFILYGTNNRKNRVQKIDFSERDVIYHQFGYVDVVLIRTQKRMQLTGKNAAGPTSIKLPRSEDENPIVGDPVVVSGWGYTCETVDECIVQNKIPDILQVIKSISLAH